MYEKFAKNIVNMGAKLGNVGAVVKQSGVSDGPYVELKELVGGYMTITADSLEEAVAIIKESPMVMNPEVSVEVREVATLEPRQVCRAHLSPRVWPATRLPVAASGLPAPSNCGRCRSVCIDAGPGVWVRQGEPENPRPGSIKLPIGN